MKIVCISDTHGEHEAVRLPAGDVLVHAGDCTAHGSRDDYCAFIEWLASQPHEHKIFIGGNHDSYLESHPTETAALAVHKQLHYLCDSGIELEGVKFWGSPITPQFHDWSFMRNEQEIKAHWALIPEETQILITHGPVWGVLDLVKRSETYSENTGCPSLAERVEQVQPEYHLFGHIHEGYGKFIKGSTQFLNISTMNVNYKIQNPPVVFEIDG